MFALTRVRQLQGLLVSVTVGCDQFGRSLPLGLGEAWTINIWLATFMLFQKNFVV